MIYNYAQSTRQHRHAEPERSCMMPKVKTSVGDCVYVKDAYTTSEDLSWTIWHLPAPRQQNSAAEQRQPTGKKQQWQLEAHQTRTNPSSTVQARCISVNSVYFCKLSVLTIHLFLFLHCVSSPFLLNEPFCYFQELLGNLIRQFFLPFKLILNMLSLTLNVYLTYHGQVKLIIPHVNQMTSKTIFSASE